MALQLLQLKLVSIVNPQPQVSAKSTDYTLVNTNLPLSSIFNSSISPSGSNDVIDHYTIINTLQGPGELVINKRGLYSGRSVVNVSPAAFQTAYFTASQPGTDEIDVVAFDSIGNSSNLASTNDNFSGIADVAARRRVRPSDLKISTASLISSNLVAGGGGTVALSVTNLGANSAPNTALTQLYLSTNTTLDSSDILVSPGAISDAGLAADPSRSGTLSFTLPSNIPGFALSHRIRRRQRSGRQRRGGRRHLRHTDYGRSDRAIAAPATPAAADRRQARAQYPSPLTRRLRRAWAASQSSRPARCLRIRRAILQRR